MSKDPFAAGRERLARPLLPLVRLVQLLFLTGPFASVSQVLEELPEPVEMEHILYEEPRRLLLPYLPVLAECERLKNALPPARLVTDEDGSPLDPWESVELWICQQILTRELEEINSLLCGPCGCRLCCIGPDSSMAQEFFEIPLADQEVDLFRLPRTDSAASRRLTSHGEPPLLMDGIPFYRTGQQGLYRWQTGWSLVLPRSTICPQLETADGRCRIYARRPEVCRRPQIFAYALESREGQTDETTGKELPAYIARRKLLAVWDCPYVRELKEEIARYGELSGLEPVFRSNKA